MCAPKKTRVVYVSQAPPIRDPRDMRVLLVFMAAGTLGAEDVDCKSMRTKQLRQFLHARGLTCEGCAEKQDFVQMCEANKHLEVKPPPEPAPPAGDDGKQESIEELMAKLKGMPGMEGLNMFSGDDLKNMNPEQMGNTFGGKKRRSRREYRNELVDFYTRYGMTDKLEGVDAALDKWKGREEKMMSALYKKYDAEIKEHWDKEYPKQSEEAPKEEL